MRRRCPKPGVGHGGARPSHSLRRGDAKRLDPEPIVRARPVRAFRPGILISAGDKELCEPGGSMSTCSMQGLEPGIRLSGRSVDRLEPKILIIGRLTRQLAGGIMQLIPRQRVAGSLNRIRPIPP